MSDELYENLKKMYNDFSMEKESLKQNTAASECSVDNTDNSNCYQLEKDRKSRLKDLSLKQETLGKVLNIFEASGNMDGGSTALENICPGREYDKDDVISRLQILDIQEKERQRIARDLHDTSLQNLTHLIHKIELSSLYIDEDKIKAKLELAAISKDLKSVIQEIRNTIFDLRPMTFDDLGFKDSFDRLADKLRYSSDMVIDYKIEKIGCTNSLVLMTIFRIVEECVNNAIKHSGGSRVYFEIKSDKRNNCIITVSDDGKSFNCDEVLSVENMHFGLCILKERVKLLSGTINIDSRPENGTTVNIVIPLLD